MEVQRSLNSILIELIQVVLFLQWLPLPAVVGYRLLLALYCASWIIYSIISDNTWKWLIFLTDWTFLCVTSYFICSTVISVIYWTHVRCQQLVAEGEQTGNSHYTTPRQSASDSNDDLLEEQHYDAFEEPEQISPTERASESDASMHYARLQDVDYPQTWYHKVSWVLYIIAANNSLLVTVIYWTLLYTGFRVREADVAFHLLNSVFMLIETCFSGIPVRLFHVVYAMLYGVLYLLFSVVYWLLGGTNGAGDKFIYPILNYEANPSAAILLVSLYGLVGLPMAQLINFGLFSLRCYLKSLRSS